VSLATRRTRTPDELGCLALAERLTNIQIDVKEVRLSEDRITRNHVIVLTYGLFVQVPVVPGERPFLCATDRAVYPPTETNRELVSQIKLMTRDRERRGVPR